MLDFQPDSHHFTASHLFHATGVPQFVRLRPKLASWHFFIRMLLHSLLAFCCTLPSSAGPPTKVILSGMDLHELERVQRLCILAWMKAVDWEIFKVRTQQPLESR